MKHSASGSMTESCEAIVALPCEGSCESVLQKLYIDLCNLIVESRIPGLNDRGYGDGVHCPPLLGLSKHACDLVKPECQKHQTIIHHLLETVSSNIFQIEVLLLPECCLESKLKERIQNKEYVLVERWSMNFIHGNEESNIEVSQLLRAVRSFLHFSQLSAWLSSTNGKSPANICYWVNPKLEALCTKFNHEPEVHSFPICKINEDLHGSVKVEFPTRTQYIPIIPCSKHPPICRYSLREINEDSDLCQNIPFNPQIVRQLHKTCDNEQNNVTAINYVPETTLMLTPSLLKTFSAAKPDGSKANRVLKHSNLQENVISSENLPLDVKGKIVDIIPKNPSTFVCNYAETIALDVSQENICCKKKRLTRHLCKTELKLKKIKDPSTPLASESLAPILSSDIYKLNQNTLKHSVKMIDVSQVSNLLNEENCKNSLLNCIESSPVNLEKHTFSSSHNLSRQLANTTKALKRKDSDLNTEEICVLSHKKICCDIKLSSQIFQSSSAFKCTTSLPQCTKTSQIKGKANFKRAVVEEFQENSSCTLAIPSNCGNDIKMFEVKHQHCSNYLFPLQCVSESMLARQEKDFVNSTNSHAGTKMFNRSVLSKILKKSKANVSGFNSETKLSKRKYKSQLDSETNASKKSKPLDECNKFLNLHSDSICTISKPPFTEANQKNYLDSNNSDKKMSLEKYFLKSTNLSKGLFEKSCSSLARSKSICNSLKQITDESVSSNDIPKSNSSYEKDGSVKRYHIYQRKKTSLNYLESSFELQSVQHKDKNFQTQENNLRRFDRLFLLSDQIASENNVQDMSNMISENATDVKLVNPISLCEHDCKTSHMPKIKIERASAMTFKERHLERTLPVIITTNNKPVLKGEQKGNKEDKPVYPALLKDLKLNKLFKFRKASYQNNFKRKNNISVSPTYFHTHIKSNPSQSVSEKAMAFSLDDCQSNMFSTNVPKELISNASANCTKELQRTATNFSKDVNAKNDNSSSYHFSSSLNPLKLISLQNDHQSSFVLNTPVPTASRNLCQVTDENPECFPKRIAKFPKGRKLLMNFEESILKGCLPMINNVKGFRAEIGASGSFCPNHLTLPADVSFYELGHPNQGTTPYVAHISLRNSEYYLPKKGAVQVTLFNPSETVVKMFVLNYDLSSMPPLCHTFIRQKTYYLPVGINKEYPASQKWLRFIIHLRFASSKTGRISLHEDFKIVVLNKTNDDAASEFSQEPRELCSFLSVPMNPTFSNI